MLISFGYMYGFLWTFCDVWAHCLPKLQLMFSRKAWQEVTHTAHDFPVWSVQLGEHAQCLYFYFIVVVFFFLSFFFFLIHPSSFLQSLSVFFQMSPLQFLFFVKWVQNSGLPKPAFFCSAWISASRAVSCSCNWNIMQQCTPLLVSWAG